MTQHKPHPGVARPERDAEESLKRLAKHLSGGTMSRVVLRQWIKRYGDKARDLIKQHKQYDDDLE